MKFRFLFFVSITLLQACTSLNKKVYWVSGQKSDCTNAYGNSKCLLVYKGDSLENAKWEYFYDNIEGFNFEEGFLKKIEVKETKIDPKLVRADGSSIKYTIIRELDKKADRSNAINGGWLLTSLNNSPVNRAIVVPEIQIDLTKMQVSGNGGCNAYSAAIEKLSGSTLVFKNIFSSKKACSNKNIESDYFKTLTNVNRYQIKNNELFLYNMDGENLARFIKHENKQINPQLHGNWHITQIRGNLINQESKRPQLEINLAEMKISGTDSCNRFSGSINEISDKAVEFGLIATTRKMCNEMEVANNFTDAIHTVTSYELNGLYLNLLDRYGNIILQLLKAE